MHFTNEGLSLWYGTPDAPAPGDTGVAPRRGASLVVAVHPANPINAVSVRYRVDGGREGFVAAREVRTDHTRQAQYFSAVFPEFSQGHVVEYAPVLTSAGRQVPAPHLDSHFPSKFVLEPAEARTASRTPEGTRDSRAGGRRFTAELRFVAAVSVCFESPQYVGDTPAGMRVNFFVRDGHAEGENFKAKILEHSSDHMLVRPDGIGLVRVRAAFATTDGARLDVESGGHADFGPDGYRRALAGELPDRAPLVITPLISTRHPRYRELSRVQCIGVGETNLAANRVSYVVYAALSRPAR